MSERCASRASWRGDVVKRWCKGCAEYVGSDHVCPPTETQAAVLAFVREFAVRYGFPPTLHEICDEFGWAATQAATDKLRALSRKGLLAVAPGISRGIVTHPDHMAAVRADYGTWPS